VPVWCQFTDDPRRFYFGFKALLESIWNDESNEIEISRFHCKVAKMWIFRNSDSKSLCLQWKQWVNGKRELGVSQVLLPGFDDLLRFRSS
jgi:hypothetical protein